MSTTIVLPLSDIDHSGVATSTITYGYVVEAIDEPRLIAAVSRVVEKWRLLAGRLELNSDTKKYHIRTIPTPHSLPDDYARVTFTSTNRSTESLGVYVEEKTADTLSILATPPIAYFRDPSIPNSVSQYASRSLPILSVHVSQFADGACVGIVFPHGVFDATGMGMVIKFLNAEIHGKEWTPPTLQPANLLDDALSKLRESSPSTTESSASLADLKRNFGGAGVANIASLVASLVYENYWQGSEQRALYMGANIVNQIVDKVKEQVVAEGKGWVSTGDILQSWFLKAAYLKEGPTSKQSLEVSTTMSVRTSLPNTELLDYPHNSLIILSLPAIPVNKLADMSVAELALMNRKNINDNRNLSYVPAYDQFMRSLGETVLPLRSWSVDAWGCSNQSLGRPDNINFGSGKTLMLWHYMKPIRLDHAVFLIKFQDGYILDVGIRQSRWDAVVAEVKRMNEGLPSRII